jgi:hypothetical protein
MLFRPKEYFALKDSRARTSFFFVFQTQGDTPSSFALGYYISPVPG